MCIYSERAMSGDLVGDIARWMGVRGGRQSLAVDPPGNQAGRQAEVDLLAHLPYLCTAVLGVCGPAKICTFGYIHPGTWHLYVRPARRREVGGGKGGKEKTAHTYGQQEGKRIWALPCRAWPCLDWTGLAWDGRARTALARCRRTAEVEVVRVVQYICRVYVSELQLPTVYTPSY